MADEFELDVELRTDLGKGASRRLRREANLVPAVLYGAHQEPVSISIPHKDLQKSCENEAFFAHIIRLNVNGRTENVIIKSLQRHPAKNYILHADFQRVQMGQMIHVDVPLHFIHEENCVGVKQDNGMISHVMSVVQIACLPGDLPEYVEVDVLNLHLGDAIHMSELALPAGVSIPELEQGEDHDQVVVSIVGTRANVEAEAVEDSDTEPEESDS